MNIAVSCVVTPCSLVELYRISFCPSSNCVNILVFYQITRCHFPNTAILNQAGLEVGHRIGMKEENVY
jgi:hypothetical protein